MMKKRSFALAMAFVLALILTGCSASREDNTLEPSHSVTGSHNDARNTDGLDDGNDAFQGGGAGGTNDRDNDGRPDSGIGSDDQSGAGQAVDDIGRAAGDLARGVGDVARDAGNAVGNAADGVGRAIR